MRVYLVDGLDTERRWRWEGQTWQEKDHVEDEQGTIWVFEHKVRAFGEVVVGAEGDEDRCRQLGT